MPKKKVTEAVEETAQETIPVEKAPAQMPRRQGTVDPTEASKIERAEIERRLAPFMAQLPMYSDRVERVFTQDR